MCLSCLARLAVEQPSLHEELLGERTGHEAAIPDGSSALLRPGQILGNRYQIRTRLGGGGMGEVWRAFDLKLRVDVALKALHPRLLASQRALETLRQEVRAAREIVSPNVCRVFNLVELDDGGAERELVSMEYVDGQTLTEVLRERSPLELDEARDIAAQMLAGFEAIRDAGLVQRTSSRLERSAARKDRTEASTSSWRRLRRSKSCFSPPKESRNSQTRAPDRGVTLGSAKPRPAIDVVGHGDDDALHVLGAIQFRSHRPGGAVDPEPLVPDY